MMVRGLAVFCIYLMLFSFRAAALDCGAFLTTSISIAGSATALVGHRGQIEMLNDGYWQSETGEVVSRFEMSSEAPYLGSFGRIQSTAMKPQPWTQGSYLAAVDNHGILKLIVPGSMVYPVRFSGNLAIDQVDIYRTPVARFQSEVSFVTKLRTPDGENNLVNDPWAATEQFARYSPLYVYAVRNKQIIKIELVPQKLEAEGTVTKALLESDVVQVKMARGLPGERMREEVTPLKVPIIDLDLLGSQSVIYINTGFIGESLLVKTVESAYSIPNSAIKDDKIDYIKVLSHHRVLLATEIGEIAIVNFPENRVEHLVGFNMPTGKIPWIGSLSGYTKAGVDHVWAVNLADKMIYHWSSNSVTPLMTPWPSQLTKGVTPIQIATDAQRLPWGYKRGNESDNGYYTRVLAEGERLYLARVVVMGSDGQLYGWADPEPKHLIVEEPKWVTHPFLQSGKK